MIYDFTDFMCVVCSFLSLAVIGWVIIAVHSPATDRNYLQCSFFIFFSISFACFIYYAADDFSAGGKGFRGGDDRMWFEAGQNTLTDLKSGRSLYDLLQNGVYVDSTSPMHPATTIDTGRIGYPLLLSLLMAIGVSDLKIIMIFNCFLGGLIPFIAYKIGNSLTCPFDGRKAVLFVSLSQLIFYAGANYRDVHIGFLFAISTLICIRFIKKPSASQLLQLSILTFIVYLFRYISGLIFLLSLLSLIVIFVRVKYKYIVSIFLILALLIILFNEYSVLTEKVISVTFGQFSQTLANTGEEIGFESSSVTRTIMSQFTNSLIVLVFLPIPAIILQLLSPPVDTTGALWVLYLTNAIRFIFFLPYLLFGISHIITNSKNKQGSYLVITYFIAIIAYSPISIFMGNRYMISMVSIEAVLVGMGSRNIKFQQLQIMWIVITLIYSVWHWIYRVTPIS